MAQTSEDVFHSLPLADQQAVVDARRDGIEPQPIERQAAFGLLQKVVPFRKWTRRVAGAFSTSTKPVSIAERVAKMQKPETKSALARRSASGHPRMLDGKQIADTVRAGLHRDFAAGRLPATDADLQARGAQWLVPQAADIAELGR